MLWDFDYLSIDNTPCLLKHFSGTFMKNLEAHLEHDIKAGTSDFHYLIIA